MIIHIFYFKELFKSLRALWKKPKSLNLRIGIHGWMSFVISLIMVKHYQVAVTVIAAIIKELFKSLRGRWKNWIISSNLKMSWVKVLCHLTHYRELNNINRCWKFLSSNSCQNNIMLTKAIIILALTVAAMAKPQDHQYLDVDDNLKEYLAILGLKPQKECQV